MLNFPRNASRLLKHRDATRCNLETFVLSLLRYTRSEPLKSHGQRSVQSRACTSACCGFARRGEDPNYKFIIFSVSRKKNLFSFPRFAKLSPRVRREKSVTCKMCDNHGSLFPAFFWIPGKAAELSGLQNIFCIRPCAQPVPGCARSRVQRCSNFYRAFCIAVLIVCYVQPR